MTYPPDYIVHEVDERDATVDWFFARGGGRHRIRQFALMVVGWLFAILPVVITTSALMSRNRAGGWWEYEEGYQLWDTTMVILKFLLVMFVIGFFVLYVINRVSARKRDRRKTYDEARLVLRLGIAADMYGGKYGAEPFRVERKKVVIEPYGDIGTYELRDLYREYGVDR